MANKTDDESKLAALNSATLGAQMPQITLADGSKVQTGTVGAMLINIRAYNAAQKAGELDKLPPLEEALRVTLPLLDKVGMFELFKPEEWINGDNNGRALVGRMYQQYKLDSK
ncbi:hypothetical protein M426DRAFT_324851 [Hypoxylon sp. CI-4A]|nr:hypothetical protein M426DRAFT_324851 [Hypoxylon sp. CI-4A]